VKKLTVVVILLLVVAAVGGGLYRILSTGGERIVVVHWTNGHLLRTGSGLRLLDQMAAEFNEARHRTQSGKRIEVQVYYYGSWEQAQDLLSRVTSGVPMDVERPDPTIVTPSAAHWLIPVNHAAGYTVVDPGAARSIARALIGIVTYREMAECLGWPDREIGYADIVALRNDPRGWASYSCAKAEWGQRPLVAYTDPTTSSTGRSVLFTLYAIAAGKRPEELTVDDVIDPAVVRYVQQFQRIVDHYMIGTIPLNTKIYQGPRFGHFFLMPEDNLIHLYEGTERAFFGGNEEQAPPISRSMVMIYPKEGSMARNNCACTVQAPWVTEEHVEAADVWVDYLREAEQQRDFMAAGFRPGTDLPPSDPISGRYGLDPEEPEIVFRPEQIDPAVAAAIDTSWDEVKRPGIVTFVVDTSSSMKGDKLQQAKDGLTRALDAMAVNNQVGFLSFDTHIRTQIPVEPLTANRFRIADAVQQVQANGQTALYDAVQAGIEMTDAAPGEQDAIRAVVVLTDGQANKGQTQLDDLIQMMSNDEIAIREFEGFVGSQAVDADGKMVGKSKVTGTELAIQTRYPIQIFFVGIGGDADMQVGRLFAEATGAEFQGATEKDLAEVLEEFSKYF
jgi:Ca-activated chloride channel family protein